MEADKQVQQKPKKEKPSKSQLDAMREKDATMVRGVFHFYEVPGGSISFSFKKYKGEEINTYTMQDGEVYTVPLSVARHLKENCWYPEYDYVKDEHTKNVIRATKKMRRMGFELLDAIDEEINESRIIHASVL